MIPSAGRTASGANEAAIEVDADRAESRLRTLLRCNALFSTATGVVALVWSESIAELLGIEPVWAVRVLGGGLVAFAGLVVGVSVSQAALLRPASLIVSIGDLGWVVGTLGVVAFGWLSSSGVAVMGATGLVVLGLAVAQIRARSGRA